MDVGTWLANSSWFVSIIDFASSLKNFVEFLQDYYKISNQLSDFGTLNKVLCCQFLFFSKHRHSCMIHASPWIYVSYWNYFLETTQVFWPCLDSIKLNFSPLESGPLNYFLCMESSRKLYVYKKFCLKTWFYSSWYIDHVLNPDCAFMRQYWFSSKIETTWWLLLVTFSYVIIGIFTVALGWQNWCLFWLW